MLSKPLFMLAGAGGLLAAGEARADEAYERPSTYSYAWHEPRLQSDIGVGLTLGGGVSGFTDQTMRDELSSGIGGLWDFRVSIGTHVPLGFDVSYLGTAAPVTTVTGIDNGTLVGSTAEGALRWNMLPHYVIDPYIFAGIGYQRYDLTNVKLSQADSGMKDHDNLAEFPMGAGVSVRDPSGFMADVRGTIRAATSSDLVVDPRTGSNADLHAWEASAAVGYEF